MAVRTLSPELAAKAVTELYESPKKLEDGIQHLKIWISKQPHLRALTDDQWLATFLRGCKHSLERAKEKIDLYYSLRSISPDLFSLRPHSKKFKDLLRTGSGLILPKLRDPLAPRVIIAKASLYDPTKIGVAEFFSFAHCFQQVMYLEDDAFLVNGCTCVLDLEGLTMAHLKPVTPTLLKKLVVAGQDASPLRLKSLHIINSISAFETIFNIAVRFLNEKHRKKLFVHSKDISVLRDHIPPEILPKEYGGYAGTTQEIIDYWLKKFEEYEEWFVDDLKLYGTDETKRPGKAKTAETMFGVQGSFRKLDVD